METLPLSRLAVFIRRVFALNLPEAVWISAELAQVNQSRGHLWLTLVEKSEQSAEVVAQMDAVCWSRTYSRLQREYGRKSLAGVLQSGMAVRLRVKASFHERYGLKLEVEDLDPDHTLGSLERRRQRTLQALLADGLLDRNASRPLPPVIQRIAVISAETAAGYADFSRQLKENGPGYAIRCELFPAAMQGEKTVDEIGLRLRQIARRAEEFDAIAIVRGGGGRMDLAAFDDEKLCRALADAPLPVLTGIGHEIDRSVVDRVVHRSLKTPTAVAAFVVDHLAGFELRLRSLGRRVFHQARVNVQTSELRLETLGSAIRGTADRAVGDQWRRLAALEASCRERSRSVLSTARKGLEHREAMLAALRPEATLGRGYALLAQAGRIITDPGQLSDGEVIAVLEKGKAKLLKGS